jgi:5'-methylthioadenosine phosphorylase
VDEDPVSGEAVVAHLQANAEAARRILARVLPRFPQEANWSEHRALDSALITPREYWPAATVEKLGPLLSRKL